MKVKFSIIAIFICFCAILDGAYNLAASRSAPAVWDVMRNQFKLDHETSNPAVQRQIHWIQAHPAYIQELSRSEPYIYHILMQIKKRNLPGELALIPMIESTFDPFAHSGAGAAGLWQIMPGTGQELGLKRDWWYDGRRSIGPSTDAALNYLAYLHRFFKGNWTLAIAAYDSGEGTMSKAITRGRQALPRVNFWTLPLPNETKAYIPRLLAIAAIVQHPERYNIKLPYIPHTPYFEEVNVGSQIDLTHAAKMAGISYKALIQLNPGYNRWATAPSQPHKLLIPAEKVDNFTQKLAATPKEQLVNWDRHKVQRGDSLTTIAKRYFTTTKILRELNQLRSERVKAGQYILIPSASPQLAEAKKPQKPVSTPEIHLPYKVIHFVQAGESLQALAEKYHASAAEIRIWNHLGEHSPLSKGQQLVIWKRPAHQKSYTVEQGDSLERIARHHGLKTKELSMLNPGVTDRQLKPGQQLLISG